MMKIPGFTADASLYWSSDRYRSNSTRNFGNAMEGNRIYMQKPNSQNAPGGSCYGHTSGTTITGTYDFLGRCCIHPADGFPFCIDCDVDKCYDKRSISFGGGLTTGTFQGGVFAHF